MDTKSVADKVNSICKTLGAARSMVVASSTKAKEFNIEANKLALLRTTFDQSVYLKTLIDGRMAVATGNQFSEDALSGLVKASFISAKGSPQDVCNGFAPSQGQKHFSFGSTECNEEWMYTRLSELLIERKNRFPKIVFEGGNVKFVQTEKVMSTSDGSHLTAHLGHYEGYLMFTAKEGKQSSSFNYIGFQLPADDTDKSFSLMETGRLSELLSQSSEQTQVQRVPAKFEGDVIVTPHCMSNLIGDWIGFLGAGMMLKGSSFFKGKIGERVASSLWNLQSMPSESQFASRKFWTSDGYLSKNEQLFEGGVLKNYLLDHYAAKKLDLNVSQSEGDYLRLAPGNQTLKNMISSVKKGVLMCRYSSGRPSENGDISGVAKNSYYIENGEIKFPLGETMVSGNLSAMLQSIQDVSSETISSGTWEFPWVRFSGMTVS